MRVLIITSRIDRHSGIGRYSYEVCKALEQNGVEVAILAEQYNDEVGSQLSRLLPGKGVVQFVLNIFRTRSAAKCFEIIHALDAWPYGIYGFFAMFGRRKKLFISGVGTYSIAPLLHSGIKNKLLRSAYKNANRVLSISKFVQNKIQDLTGLHNIDVVHLGLDALPQVSNEISGSFRKEKGLEGYNPIFLTVGEIKERKGQLDTLKGLALLKKEYPKFLYCMVGKDQNEKYISLIREFAEQHGLQDNIRIVSNVSSDEELAAYYSSANIFFLNSNNDDAHGHYEGFGLVCIEAAQFGVPSIGSKNCGIEDAIRDEYSGFLVSQKDPSDLSQKTREILSDIVGFSERATAFSKEFSWEKTAKNYLTYYQK